MLDERRIKEAESNVKRYTEDHLLWKYKEFRPEILKTYELNYQESLDVAQHLFDGKHSYLWVVVISYYSMYYIANAVLYKLGYKLGAKISHKVTADALIVFIRRKLQKHLLEEFETAHEEAVELMGRKADELIKSFDYELEKRSTFQYETTEDIKAGKATTSLERAKRFIFEMKKLL